MRRILVRVPQWLGDAVVSTVFLARLKSLHPEASLSVWAPARVAGVFEGHPAVDRIITLPYPAGSIFSAARAVKNEEFDAVYILPRSLRTGLEAWLSRIPKRIGFDDAPRRWLLTQTHSYDENLIYPRRYLKLIGEEHLALDSVAPYFPSRKPDLAKLERLAGRPFSSWKKPFLGVAPVSIAPSRTWPADRFAGMADRYIQKHGGTVILFGSPAEKNRVQEVRKKVESPVVDTSGELDLAELGWMMSQLNFLFANDSGLMHVASCFKIPSIIIFGASDPRTALPVWGRFVPIQNTNIACVPCGRNVCVRFGPFHNECLNTISVNIVDDALEALVLP